MRAQKAQDRVLRARAAQPCHVDRAEDLVADGVVRYLVADLVDHSGVVDAGERRPQPRC
ncbi:hypothetical protein AB0G15_34460 [Streptosporangium sp. NPDC023825]|uniref:hypothetical protein n=1 Tax=Streptosporangium sp. NPDC023825 TaxID=3154909 RepID=UPI00341E5CBD